MKVKIYPDEWFPVYCLDEVGVEIELSDAEYARMVNMLAEFDAIQEILRAKYEEQENIGRR